MNDIGQIDFIAIGVWIVVVAVTLGLFVLLFHKFLKFEDRNKNQLAFCLVFLSLGIGRIFLIYFDYGLTQLNPDDYVNHIAMWKLATFLLLIGVGFLILVSEYALWKGKDFFIFFIGFSILVTIAMIVQDFELSQTLTTAALAFAGFIPLSYFYLYAKLPTARKNIVLIFLGFSIYGGGLILLSVFIVDPSTIHLIYLISAIVQIPGLLILGVGVNRMYFSV